MKEAMKTRHMVRRYLDKALTEENVNALNKRIAENNEKYNLSMKLVTNDSSAFNAVIKLILAKGVKNFIILAGNDKEDLNEKLGYCSADLMIYAQTLGLNTWWVGGTFNRKVRSMVEAGNKVIGVVAVGYGVNQGEAHKSKSIEEVCSYNGEIPKWFENGVEAALLAPTALNKQPFMISGDGTTVKIACEGGIFAGANLGLVKYHFGMGAGVENFQWEE